MTDAVRRLGFVAGSGDVVADLDALLAGGLCVYAVTQNGKSNLIRVLLEQTYGQVLHIILDPDGEYSTLRSPERPYLIVGKGRDVELPLDDAALRQFVLTVVEKNVSVIFDMHGYDVEDEQQLIVAAVCAALVTLPENHPGNVLLVLEELQDFAPEGGGKASAIGPVRRLAKRGLKRGVAIIGCTQRISDVSKGVITMLKSKAIGGTDPIDVRRALEALGRPASDKQLLTDLPVGYFYVKGPAFSRHAQEVCLPRSISAPEKRKRGDPPVPTPEASAEIAALAAALALTVASAAATETHPKGDGVSSSVAIVSQDIDARIAAAVASARAEEEARWAGLMNTTARRVMLFVDAIGLRSSQLNDWMKTVLAAGANDAAVIAPRATEDAILPLATAAGPTNGVQRPIGPPNRRVVQGEQPDKILPGEQRIIDALSELKVVGIAQPSRAQVGAFAGYNLAAGGKPAGYVAELIANGYLSIPTPGTLALTQRGGLAVPATMMSLTRGALHQRVFEKLNDGERRLLEYLISIHPAAASRASVGAAAKYNLAAGGKPAGYVAKLVRLEFAEIPEPGMLKAGKLLFPKGLKP